MGRFYKTVAPNFAADMITDVPVELMKSTLAVHDNNIEKAQEQGGEVQKLLSSIDNLKADDELVVGEKNRFRDKVKEVEEKMISDPSNYLKYSGEIRNLSRDLSKSLDTGIFKRASENVNLKNTYETQVDESKASSTTKENARKVAERKYNEAGGVNFKGDVNYNPYASNLEYDTLFDAPDELKMINSISTNFKPDIKASSNTSATGGYLTKRGSKTVSVTAKDVDDFMEDLLTNNNWEDATRQEVYYELANSEDINITKNDPRVDAEVARRKEAFKNAAINKIAYQEKASSKDMAVDSAQQAALAYARQVAAISVNKEVDYMSDIQRSNYNVGVTKILNSAQAKELGFKNEEDLVKKLRTFNGDQKAIDNWLKGLSVNSTLVPGDVGYGVVNDKNMFESFQDRKEFVDNLSKSYSVNTGEFITMEEIRALNPEVTDPVMLNALYVNTNGQNNQFAQDVRNVDPSVKVDKIRVSFPDGSVQEVENKSYLEMIEAEMLNNTDLGSSISEVIIEQPAKNEYGTYTVNGQPAVKTISDGEGGTTTVNQTLDDIIESGQKPDTKEVSMSTESFKNGTNLPGSMVSRNKDYTGKETIATTQTIVLVGENGKKVPVTMSFENNLEDYNFSVKK